MVGRGAGVSVLRVGGGFLGRRRGYCRLHPRKRICAAFEKYEAVFVVSVVWRS